MNTQKITYSLENIDIAVDALYRCMETCKILTFEGSIGTGKTTLVRALLRRCGVKEVISSPTFTYVNVYVNDQGYTFYHFDLYRIKNVNEFLALGFDEYLHLPNSWVFIEWPEIIKPLLQKNACFINIEYVDNQRLLAIKMPKTS